MQQGQGAFRGVERSKFQEINLNLLSDLSDDSNSSSSVSSSLSSPPPPLTSMQLQQQIYNNNSYYHQGNGSGGQPQPQLIQQVHPIQTVQPFKNLGGFSKQQQQQHHHQHHHHQNTGLDARQQMLMEQQLKQELDIDLELDSSPTSSLMMNSNKHQMMQSQRLDNNAIQTLVDQTKAHLILDDKESLQVNSSNEFVSLFSNKSSSNKTMVNNQPMLSSRHDETHHSQASHSPSSSAYMSASSFLQNVQNLQQQQQQLNDDKLVKCVAIFGNTGDGKSHTLNHTFFNGRNIFTTSQKQETCTMGVWCAYDSITNSLIFDTEGLLGTTSNENKRLRLLLKVLAISDVIIYRTRAERLHNDLFKFLSDASVAYLKYFTKELKTAASKLKLDTISSLGPCCVIFHETQHTDTLCDEIDTNGHQRTVTHQLADRFCKLDLNYSAFSSIEYVGTRTSFMSSSSSGGSNERNLSSSSTNHILNNNNSGVAERNVLVTTDFTKLAQTVRDLLRNNSVRPPRKLSSIYHVLKVLNDKFNGIITKNQISTFADEYFTCSSICLSCGKRCQNSINHLKDGVLHGNNEKCHYDHQYDNKVYVCRLCHESGKETVVIPKTSATSDNSFVGIVKYTYSGYVLECPHHGIIYRSRQYWYGNPDPESVVRTELKHIWSGQQNNVGTSHNLSRKIIDNVSYIGDTLHSVSAKPTMIAKQWIADQVAPTYWTPNSEITHCITCSKAFMDLNDKKHHCRGCGKGFCDKCSSKRKIIPWWSPTDPVRVCDPCYAKDNIPEPILPNSINSNNYYATNTNTTTNNRKMINNNGSNSLAQLGMSGNNDVIARKVTETVSETFGVIAYATKIPFDVIKESARPSYWKPDSECVNCALCKKDFDDLLQLHHCRSCGNGVCNNCSPHLRPVSSRGWETPVRVCNNCVSNEMHT
jgi:zinc finger FYVE domain-containing protein 1